MNDNWLQVDSMEEWRSYQLYAIVVGFGLCKDNRKLHWVGRDRLSCFMWACHDGETGDFADRPGGVVNPVYTLFGFAVLED